MLWDNPLESEIILYLYVLKLLFSTVNEQDMLAQKESKIPIMFIVISECVP